MPRTRKLRRDWSTEEEGEGYLVSVSDLMIGLLFVFLLMLMTFVVQYRQSEHELRQQAAQVDAERARVQLDRDRLQGERDALQAELASGRASVGASLIAEIDRVDTAMHDAELQRGAMLRRLEVSLRDAGVPVRIDPGSGILRLADSVLFRQLNADLSDVPGPSGRMSARETVRRLASTLAEVIPCYTKQPQPSASCKGEKPILEAVFIEGHTDHLAIAPGGRFRDNHDLSAARALSTYRALVTDQPQLQQLRNPDGERLLGLSGYGEDRPVQMGEREEDLAANRRIDVRFLLASPPVGEMNTLRARVLQLVEPIAR